MLRGFTFAIALLTTVPAMAQSACPDAYPVSFPCVSGGVAITVPSIPASTAAAQNEKFFLAYREPPAELFEAVLAAAIEAKWTITSREVANEPSGPRYRAMFHGEQGKVFISVFSSRTGSYLLVVKGLAN